MTHDELTEQFSDVLDGAVGPYAGADRCYAVAARLIQDHEVKAVLEAMESAWEEKDISLVSGAIEIDLPERNQKLYWLVRADVMELAAQRLGVGS